MIRDLLFFCCTMLCLACLILTFHSQSAVWQTFESLKAEATQAQQIAIAQDYANTMARVAEYEAGRAHELDERIMEMATQFLQAAQNNSILKSEIVLLGMYIQQLVDTLEENQIAIPEPSFLEKKDLQNSEEHIIIETLDENGNVIDRHEGYGK